MYRNVRNILSSPQPSSPTDIDENAPIGNEIAVDIQARDFDSDPKLSFRIDWENSRAAKQGVSQDKDVFIGYVQCRLGTTE
jgi:hypothetical protein